MPSEPRQILSVRGLDVSYGDVRAVDGVSFDMAAGEVVGLVGESGSGKSSVLRALAGLLGHAGVASADSLLFSGADLAGPGHSRRQASRGSGMAYVFQDPVGSLDPLFRIGSQFDECLKAQGMPAGEDMRHLERSLLREMGFENPDGILRSYPHNLSGGMCQRVVLAFSVACMPALLLADEPTSALDVASQEQVVDLLLRIREEYGTSILVVSHNIGVIGRVSDRIGVMHRGRLVELGDRDQVLREPSHPYTRSLIAAVPVGDGSLPRLADPWEG